MYMETFLLLVHAGSCSIPYNARWRPVSRSVCNVTGTYGNYHGNVMPSVLVAIVVTCT